jgi:hypothetical protein
MHQHRIAANQSKLTDRLAQVEAYRPTCQFRSSHARPRKIALLLLFNKNIEAFRQQLPGLG